MFKSTTGNVLVLGLAVVGFLVLAGPLLKLSVGLFGLVIMLLTWMAAGVLAGRFLRGEGYGFLGDIGLGIVGGIIGTTLFSLIGLGAVAGIPIIGPIFVGAVGAVVFVYLVRLFNKNFAR